MADITNREQELFEALKPIVEPLGVKLVDIEFKTHGEESRIRVVVDDEEGVGLSLCEQITKQIDPVIELEEPELRQNFELEVSSPGLRRRLRREFEYDYFSGRRVEVKCYGTFRDRKNFSGKLIGTGEDALILEAEEKIEIPLELIASVRLFFDADEALNSGGSSNDG